MSDHTVIATGRKINFTNSKTLVGWWMSRPIVPRVTFDLPECKEVQKRKKKRKQRKKQENMRGNAVFFNGEKRKKKEK